ncbi:hemocyte protein-glutamine gamma-glutamyltransferase [Procambarus clarkii]
MSTLTRIENFLDNLADRFRREFEENRRDEKILEDEIEATHAETSETNAVKQVKIVSVDFQAQLNAEKHHCDKYKLVSIKEGTPIIRRSGSFSIVVEFNQDIDLKKQHQLTLYFSFGAGPNAQAGTLVVLVVTGKKLFDKHHENWDVRLEKQAGTKATLQIQVSSEAPVGVWTCAMEVKPKDDPDPSHRHLLRLDTLLYVLFNPWNENDSTYMEDKEKLEEYILADVGKIWQGSYPTAKGRLWVFGQFDDVVLPACVLLLERSGLRPEARGDPIRVSRAISRIVNSNDDKGVVVGRWDGTYDDGTSPSGWTGSIKILEEYVRKNKPVKYGQCWVFAGVVNTVCRALGLPARVVTNLNSAHDTNVSLTIDEYFDTEGNEIKYRSDIINPGGLNDSIWNFHVWNDVWMARPDLPDGYGGWQAIDATPQETSDGMYQCGPASLEAVRRGQMELKYDVPFVLAEVNADVVRWKEDKDSQDGFKKLFADKAHVGRQVLTKKPGPVDSGRFYEKDKEECTVDYKPQEGSREERVTLHSAARRTRAARHAFRFPSEAIEDVEFSIQDVERVPIGDDFAITVKALNTSEAKRTVTIVMTAASHYYTGAKAHDIARAEGTFVLQPKENKTLALPVTYKQYYHKLVEHAMIKLVAICTVEETSYAWFGDDRFEVLKPRINVQILAPGVAGKPLPCKFSFTNPLPIALTSCVLVIDGPGLTRPKKIPISDVGAKAEMVYELKVYPLTEANCTLVATFNSTELLNLSGSAPVEIAPAES